MTWIMVTKTIHPQKAKKIKYRRLIKKEHGENYTMMQFRKWADNLNCGTHKSMTEPPSSTMFNHAGGVAINMNKK